MTARTFAPWVGPIAQELQSNGRETVRIARQLLPEHWFLPSPLPGWTYKDLLAHLATGDWVFQWMLRGALGEETFDLMARGGFDYVNEGNASRVGERRDTPVDDLIAELEAERAETQDLLARLPENIDLAEVVGQMQDGTPVTIEMWVKGFPRHDVGHGAQLRTALDQTMM
jgi:uncharacterized protein (TIGR03083 family)